MERIKEGMSGRRVAEVIQSNFEYLDKKLSVTTQEHYNSILKGLQEQKTKVTELAEAQVLVADNEDTEAVLGTLKLADRDYDPTEASGMGFKIIRKRIYGAQGGDCPCNDGSCDCCNCCNRCECCSNNGGSTSSAVVADKYSALHQDDFGTVNTLYIIRYAFSAYNMEIKIPRGCELRFEGGSISDAKIDLNGAKITGVVGDWDAYFQNCELTNFAEGQTRYMDGEMRYWADNEWKSFNNSSEISAKLAEHNAKIEQISSKLNSLESRVNTELTNLEVVVNNMSTQITNLETTVNELSTKVPAIETEIDNINTEITNLNATCLLLEQNT